MNTWTQTPPTGFGDYWLWDGEKESKPVIVDVLCEDAGLYYVRHPDYEYDLPVSDFEHHWWCPAEHPPLPDTTPKVRRPYTGHPVCPECGVAHWIHGSCPV